MTWEEAVLWLRKQASGQQLVQDCYFGVDLAKEWARYHQSPEWAEARSLLGGNSGSGGKALDLGAGRGIVSYALAVDGWQPVALEPDPSPVVGVGAFGGLIPHGVVAVRGVGENIPLADAVFDVVLGRAVLHHSQNLYRLCAEVSRVMKKGGLFLAMREHVISRQEDLPFFLEQHPLHRHYGGENAFPLHHYLNAFRQAGLQIRHIYGPACSDINLHPRNKQQAALARKRKLLNLVPLSVAGYLDCLKGKASNEPGRLYSFLLTK